MRILLAAVISGTTFRQMVASSDGLFLYGLDAGSPSWQRVRIFKIDAGTGQIVAEKNLNSDVWYLTLGSIPPAMHGHLDLAVPCGPRP